MADDNVLQFTSNNRLVTINPGKTIIVVRPDGKKLRGGDMVPLADLPREALLTVIDELCDMIARK
jgi:hypothetical protein